MTTGEMSASCGSKALLNVVLVGGRNSGKSSVGNMILGREEFVTKERTTCSRRLGEVAGWWVTVVDTPGWWCDFTAQDTPRLVKTEISRSISLCLPGPHVFLIVVKARSAFSEKRRRAVEEHLALFGEKVWSHCLVLFTFSDWSKNPTVEQHITTGGRNLQWLREQCNHRYHSVNFKSQPGGAQITELFEKMERLVVENGRRHFEMEGPILLEAEERKRKMEHLAQKRFMMMKRQRTLHQGECQRLSEVRLVLLGARGSGKSSTGNTIMGGGGSLQVRRTAQCETRSGSVSGRHVSVVDTPGWWMNYFTEDSPAFDQREVVRSVSTCPPGPHAVLLVVRVDRAFTETYRRAVQEHLELFTEKLWDHLMVVFSFGDWLGETTIEQYIESEGEALRWLVEKCDNRYHILNNKSNGNGFQVTELLQKIEEMVATNRGGHYEFEREVLQVLKERMETEEDRAAQRLIRTQTQRTHARSLMGELHFPSELRLVLMGARNAGKSSAGNTILGREQFDVGFQTTGCAEGHRRIRGQSVTVLDTPGCLSAGPDFLVSSPAYGATVLLVVVNMSSSFTLSQWKTTEKHLEQFGERVRSRAVVVFTFGDWLGDTIIEQRIESEGEGLQRLVDMCRNRYHVLDNKNWGTGDQVRDLLNKIDEMLAEERLEVLQRGDQMNQSIPVMQDPQSMSKQRKVVDVPMINTDGFPSDLCAVSSSEVLAPPVQSEVHVLGDQEVALIGATGGMPGADLSLLDREGHLSGLDSLLQGRESLRWRTTGRQTLVVNLPDWHHSVYSHLYLSKNGKIPTSPFSPGQQSLVVVIPMEKLRAEDKMLLERNEDVVDVRSLNHPRFRDRAIREMVQSGGIQALIDQWGNSNLEELESFIDSYFEMVLEETMKTAIAEDCAPDDCSGWSDAVEEPEAEVLSSIDRKLSKLDILEDMQRDLMELKQSLERSWKIIQQLCDGRAAAQDPASQGK
ncbi:GTPase IMAP family member 8 isoform X2 [Osmerus eperlanus]|uniref:GTPase IMAP family member 8 isoform X2 n=1 Tax=Osmerus eperlanus TaxID=29151 RepID=UPI002E159E83